MTKLIPFCALALLVNISAHANNEQTVYQYPQVQPAGEALQSLHKTSVEYWQTVSGKELKTGIPVFVSQSQHFIRIAPRAHFDSGEIIKPQSLASKAFIAKDADTQKELSIHVVAEQQHMREAGFDDGSVGIKLANIKAQGQTLLRTKQALNDNDEYLVHVIEKGSRQALKANTQFTLGQYQQRLDISLDLGDAPLKNEQVKLRLHSPVSEKVDVAFDNGEAVFAQPLTHLGAAQGYYELEATVTTQMNGQTIKRSVQMPFVYSAQTIVMDTATVTALADNHYQAIVPVEVEMHGRYAIRATLRGQSNNGDPISIATVEVAKNISSADQFVLPFTSTQAVYGPYQLVDVELIDQTRMLKFTPQ
ncbi:DUF4785 domain-containing protein [Pseudoalteromonas sp. SSDWG2]|uniref:DUF4785 domain-containing protein n=1 Tax=Pseudoalteromonas sp. SSDWG2 TaxID=3139391 RepID=UPI003BAD8FB7